MAAPKAKRSKVEAEDPLVDDQDINLLEGIQDQIEELNDRATEEILEVEKKYNRLRKPLYEKRAEAITKLPDFWFKVVSFIYMCLRSNVLVFFYFTSVHKPRHACCIIGW